MRTTEVGAALAACEASLDDDNRRSLRRYWERVIWEEWVPPSRWERRMAPVDGARRAREARRAMARVAAAGRLAPVVSLSTCSPATAAGVAGSGVAA